MNLHRSIIDGRLGLLACVAIIAMVGQVSAISPHGQTIKPSFGIRIGLALSDWRGDAADGKNISFKPGFMIGGFYAFQIGPDVVVQSELLICKKGARINYDYPIYLGELHLDESATLYYAELPLLVKLPIPWDRNLGVSLFLGPVGAISLVGKRSGTRSSDYQEIIPNGSYNGDIGNTRRFNFGFTIGAETRFGSGHRRYLLDIRYTAGLLGAFADIDDVGSIPDGEMPFVRIDTGKAEVFKNGTFMISFGISFER